eukprot:g4725.t1
MLAPRRRRRVERDERSQQARLEERLHRQFGVSWLPPSSVYSEGSTASLNAPASVVSPSRRMFSTGGSSVLRGPSQDNDSGDGTHMGAGSKSTRNGGKLLSASSLQRGSQHHRIRLLSVGPKDLEYSGQLFNPDTVTEVGNFTISDVIGRNYSPAAAGLTLRVIDALYRGAPTAADAQEFCPASQRHSTTGVLDASRLKLKTGEKVVVAMRAKTRLDCLETSLKRKALFEPKAWNPRGLAPKVVVPPRELLLSQVKTFEKKLAARHSSHQPSMLKSMSSPVIPEDKVPLHRPSNAKGGDYLLSSNSTLFESRSVVVTNEGELRTSESSSTSLTSCTHLMESIDPQPMNTLLHERVQAFRSRESEEHVRMDSSLRKALVLEALRRMAVYPDNKRSKQILLDNLKELALAHRYASCRAGMIYEGFDFMENRDTSNSLHIPSIYRSTDWIKLRKTGISHHRVENARENLNKILCTCEPLQKQLKQLWFAQQEHMKLSIVNSPAFVAELPMPLSDFRSYFVDAVVGTRNALMNHWVTGTLRSILVFTIVYLRQVRATNSSIKQKQKEDQILSRRPSTIEELEVVFLSSLKALLNDNEEEAEKQIGAATKVYRGSQGKYCILPEIGSNMIDGGESKIAETGERLRKSGAVNEVITTFSEAKARCERQFRIKTKAIPDTTETLKSSAVNSDHPSVLKAENIIKRCVDLTYDSAKLLLPTLNQFCFVFDPKEDDEVASLVNGIITITNNTTKMVNQAGVDVESKLEAFVHTAVKYDNQRKLIVKYYKPSANQLRDLADYGNECNMRCSLLKARVGCEAANVSQWHKKINYFFRKSKSIIKEERQRRAAELSEAIRKHETELKDTESDIKGLRRSGSLQQHHRIALNEKLVRCRTSLEKLEVKSIEINKLEKILNPDKGATDYKKRLTAASKLLKPYEALWASVEDYYINVEQWRYSPLISVDASETLSTLGALQRSLQKGRNFLRKQNGAEPLQAIDALLVELEEFESTEIPLIELFCTPALKERHWQQIANITGLDVIDLRSSLDKPRTDSSGSEMKVSDGRTISQLVEIGMLARLSRAEDICNCAAKEYSIEKLMKSMKEEWEGICFETVKYRESGTSILRRVDDIQTLLDDQRTKTDAMSGSRFAKVFAEEIAAWHTKLSSLDSMIGSWLAVQGVWLYLEPIFSSDDIRSQMPLEAARFETVDAVWRKSMMLLQHNAEAIVVAENIKLARDLVQAQELLGDIQKGLNLYLEKKRLFFPRFFFLSNDEMLEILAETKDPLRVQPHLKKCFEGITCLEILATHDILGMYSSEGEYVPFKYDVINETGRINPDSANGLVEKWLNDVERVMRKSVAESIRSSIEAYALASRTDWIVKWPGQVVLCVTQLYWTRAVEKALESEHAAPRRLQEVMDICTHQIQDIVELVRGKLDKLSRKTISPLIVLDVHARDVVQELIQDSIVNKNDFSWQSQLRYYFDAEGTSFQTAEPGSVQCRMITAERNYANEYLGNSMRLVITPLTDRCYRTLMGAIHLNYGGAPEGPAGTGKTETVKDLGKALAIQCVVYNCSDSLDYKAMGKFFKGLAGTGAWSCFDEFNRIELEVLSVVAQQILTIQLAKIARKRNFEFEGTWCKLIWTCNVFVTMNPGYAGRQELPDNLKALMRTVAMMVPDYAMIANCILYSMGYLEAESLSIKIVATFKLCSEQLSSQRHYDYGMRAVMGVLRAAGSAKRKDPECDESIMILRVLKEVNMPKFLKQDLPLFLGIIGDLFPGKNARQIDRPAFMAMLRSNCLSQKPPCQPVNSFLNKIAQVYEIMLVRHGFMVVGRPMAGKSAGLRVLAKTLGDMYEKEEKERIAHPNMPDSGYRKVQSSYINPKALSMGHLYGEFDRVSHEWTDGALPILYREYANDASPDLKWIVFDGPVDAIWIENMNTVLDDNKKLCLMSGEMIPMSSKMSMIFEPMDLEVASPATVSRVGVVYLEPLSVVGWKPL